MTDDQAVPPPDDCPEYLTRPCLCEPACCPHCPHSPAPQPGDTMNDTTDERIVCYWCGHWDDRHHDDGCFDCPCQIITNPDVPAAAAGPGTIAAPALISQESPPDARLALKDVPGDHPPVSAPTASRMALTVHRAISAYVGPQILGAAPTVTGDPYLPGEFKVFTASGQRFRITVTPLARPPRRRRLARQETP